MIFPPLIAESTLFYHFMDIPTIGYNSVIDIMMIMIQIAINMVDMVEIAITIDITHTMSMVMISASNMVSIQT